MINAEKNLKFKVNDYLTLKQNDEGKTIIFVNGKPFRSCRFLLINIPVEEISDIEEIESIDEAAERLDKSLEPLRERKQFKYSIPPDVEFWGHCSNLQVWSENGYNTRLLHANLAFPLLKELTRAGDPQAEKVFKEEIAERYNSGIETVREYLRSMKYLNFLSVEEYLSLIEDETEREIVEYLRKTYPRFETHEMGGSMVKANIDIKNGKVVKIDIGRLKLRQIPECVRSFTMLRHFIIVYNLLERLPEWVGEFKSLKIFEMDNNLLKSLPEEIGNLENLVILYAHRNQLEALPESIGNLSCLKILQLYENGLTSLPDSLGNLNNLEKLELHKNKLTNLPQSIGNLKNLEVLDLHDNQVTSLPESIGDLITLKMLIIASNNIKYYPPSIEKLEKLERLSISDNPVNVLPRMVYNLPNLEMLFVRHLKESQIKKEKFQKKFITIFIQDQKTIEI